MLADRDETDPRQASHRPRQRRLSCTGSANACARLRTSARHDAQGAWRSMRKCRSAIWRNSKSARAICSIVLLRRIARAIGLPVTQLVHEGAEPPLDLVLLTQFLERLPPDGSLEARKLVTEHFCAPSEDCAPAHRADRPARRRQVHARPPAGGTSRRALHRTRPRDRAAQRRHLERNLRHVRPGNLPPRRARGARRRVAPAPAISSSPPAAASSPNRARLNCCWPRASRSGCAPSRKNI